jgi:hypothetical protein
MARKVNGCWISEYFNTYKGISEAPHNFLIWSSIAVIAAVLKDHVWMDAGSFKCYPNMYVILTSPPGIGKGSAMNPALAMLKESKAANVLTDRVTAQKIVEKMAIGFGALPISNTSSVTGNTNIILKTESACLLVSPELPNLLGSGDWMLTSLCSMWDQREFAYETKNKGSNIIENMCTSLLGGCVPEYIKGLGKVNSSVVTSGFTARACFVYADKSSQRIPWAKSVESTPNGRLRVQNMTEDLTHISQISGEMAVTYGAQLVFANFYNKLRQTEEDTDVEANFKSRIKAHVFKVAMVFSASEGDDKIISESHMTRAILAVESVLGNLARAFRGFGDSDIAAATARVQSFIEKKGVTSRAEILATLHRNVSPETLERVLTVLKAIGFCTTNQQGSTCFIKHTKGSKA